MNKGELRQAYTMFYANEAKQIIDEYYNKGEAAIGKFSKAYNVYSIILLSIFAVAFISAIICLFWITLPLMIIFFIMIVFMPKRFKQEAQQYNDNNAVTYDSNRSFDNEMQLKNKLMNKFLSIFGEFTWLKGKSFVDIHDLIILPDKLSLDTDDSIKGIYSDVNIKMTEVYFGFNAIFKTITNHIKKINYLQIILPIFFIILAVVVVIPVAESIKTTLFFSYTTFFMIVWCLGFFSPLIFLTVYLINRKNRGLLVEFYMPKDFTGEIVVFEKNKTNRSVNKKSLKNFEIVNLEDVEFNKKYFVYGTNQVETRYVLTTSLIERLQNIKFKFDAKYLRFAFRNHRMTIFISSENDLFRMLQKDKKTDLSTFNELFEEIYSILLLVDEMKLNIKTGL